jgi:hypothetical protein
MTSAAVSMWQSLRPAMTSARAAQSQCLDMHRFVRQWIPELHDRRLGLLLRTATLG